MNINERLEQSIEANKIELERLQAIYIQISEYAKQTYGMSLSELDNRIDDVMDAIRLGNPDEEYD